MAEESVSALTSNRTRLPAGSLFFWRFNKYVKGIHMRQVARILQAFKNFTYRSLDDIAGAFQAEAPLSQTEFSLQRSERVERENAEIERIASILDLNIDTAEIVRQLGVVSLAVSNPKVTLFDLSRLESSFRVDGYTILNSSLPATVVYVRQIIGLQDAYVILRSRKLSTSAIDRVVNSVIRDVRGGSFDVVRQNLVISNLRRSVARTLRNIQRPK